MAINLVQHVGTLVFCAGVSDSDLLMASVNLFLCKEETIYIKFGGCSTCNRFIQNYFCRGGGNAVKVNTHL